MEFYPMKIFKKSLIFFPALFLSATTFADIAIPHTIETAYSENGTWHATLTAINEHATFSKIPSGEPLSEFILTDKKPERYIFNLKAPDNFDVAYALTLTQKVKNNMAQFVSKTCVFIVTAISPANPDVQSLSYNGAICHSELNATGSGDNFYVS
jgi:hypothetical protein